MIAELNDGLFNLESAPTTTTVPAGLPAGEAKRFRHYDQEQQFLLPPSLDDWLGEDEEARFVSEIVDEHLDLTPIYASYRVAKGAPPYDPAMMLKVLLYAYSTGVTSSREVERRCRRDLAFRWLSANQAPDYRSLARFRKRHLEAFSALFTQVLTLCAQAGLVKLGRVALDGTKLTAAASKHKAMSYDRLGPKIDALQSEVEALLVAAVDTDAAEDAEYGEHSRGDVLPKELARRESRLVKLRAAQQAIEEAAAENAAQAAREKAAAKGADADAQEDAAREAAAAAEPAGRTQRNFTDPDARIMKTNHGFEYAYNAQAVVDDTHQVIIAVDVSQQATDVQQLVPMVDVMGEQLAAAGIPGHADVFLADAGYFSKANHEAGKAYPSHMLIATGRERTGEPFLPADEPLPEGATAKQQMAHQLRQPDGQAHYARRKAIVEPVFGQLKTRQHAGKLRLRGQAAAAAEWVLHAACHNLRKLRTGLAANAPAGSLVRA